MTEFPHAEAYLAESLGIGKKEMRELRQSELLPADWCADEKTGAIMLSDQAMKTILARFGFTKKDTGGTPCEVKNQMVTVAQTPRNKNIILAILEGQRIRVDIRRTRMRMVPRRTRIEISHVQGDLWKFVKAAGGADGP